MKAILAMAILALGLSQVSATDTTWYPTPEQFDTDRSIVLATP